MFFPNPTINPSFLLLSCFNMPSFPSMNALPWYLSPFFPAHVYNNNNFVSCISNMTRKRNIMKTKDFIMLFFQSVMIMCQFVLDCFNLKSITGVWCLMLSSCCSIRPLFLSKEVLFYQYWFRLYCQRDLYNHMCHKQWSF